MSSNSLSPNSDDIVFIPCEICDEPVAIENYNEHTNACNSARFVEFHGVSLDELINPVATFLNPGYPVPPMIDFPDNLVSEDEREHEDEIDEQAEDEIGSEDEGPIAGETHPNVQAVPMAVLIRALMGNDTNPDEIIALQPQNQEPPSINNRLQNLITAAILGQQQGGGLGVLNNLEDIVVGLTPEQRGYCFTSKTLTEPVICYICCEDNLTQIITLICGHELCSHCATRHFTANVKCPFCNQDLRDIINDTTTTN